MGLGQLYQKAVFVKCLLDCLCTTYSVLFIALEKKEFLNNISVDFKRRVQFYMKLSKRHSCSTILYGYIPFVLCGQVTHQRVQNL